jgi:hypothetical protein
VPPRTPERAPDPEAQPEAANWRRIALAMATNAAKAAGRRPTFAGLDTENPAEFLEEYKRYSTDAQVPPEKKLSEAIRCLRQTAARWAKFHQGKWQSFPKFRAEFLVGGSTTDGSSVGFEPTLQPDQRGLDDGLLHGAGHPAAHADATHP